MLDAGGTDHAGRAAGRRARGWSSSRCSAAPPGTSTRCARACAGGHTGLCEQRGLRPPRPGLQTGFCADTGGGWSHAGLVAHASQLHAVPDELLATRTPSWSSRPPAPSTPPCRPGIADGDTVAVLGAGTLGLAVVAALDHLVATGRTGVHGAGRGQATRTSARWPSELGADAVVAPDQLARAVRRAAGRWPRWSLAGRLTGGADVVLDCVGSRRVARPSRWPWSGPGAGWCWSACPAGSRSTWPRCGTAS